MHNPLLQHPAKSPDNLMKSGGSHRLEAVQYQRHGALRRRQA